MKYIVNIYIFIFCTLCLSFFWTVLETDRRNSLILLKIINCFVCKENVSVDQIKKHPLNLKFHYICLNWPFYLFVIFVASERSSSVVRQPCVSPSVIIETFFYVSHLITRTTRLIDVDNQNVG